MSGLVKAIDRAVWFAAVPDRATDPSCAFAVAPAFSVVAELPVCLGRDFVFVPWFDSATALAIAADFLFG